MLGAMLLSRGAAEKAFTLLAADAFYKPLHRRIFEAMERLARRDEPIDMATLVSELEKGAAGSAGGVRTVLESLHGRVVSAAHLEHHARIVYERWLKRKLLDITTEIQSDCYDGTNEASAVLDSAERKMFAIAEHCSRDRGSYSMKRLTIETLDALRRVRNNQGSGTMPLGVASGFTELDALVGGFAKSDLTVIAARPAMGKSGLALSIARNVAVDQGVPVGYFTLEMSPHQLMLRLISAEAGIDAQALRTGTVNEQEWARLQQALVRMTNTPLFIEDAPGMGIMELRTRARQMKREHKIGLIVIDYLQLMTAPKAERREREISMISKSLKGLAKELDVPVIALSQLNRAVEMRLDKRPMLSDLRESGAIEEDSDVVMFIHRPEYYGERYYEDGDPTEGIAEIIVSKHRNGPTGSVKLAFMKEYARFGNSAVRERRSRYRQAANGDSF